MNCDFVVFDLETTGLSPRSDEIIQIAGTRLGSGGTQTGEHFATFVRPECGISAFITGLTGISNRDVADAPSPREALARFSEFVGDAVLIAHNGQRFDAKFLWETCNRQRVDMRPVPLIDSIQLSKRLFGSARGMGHGLDAVLFRLGVHSQDGRRHDARGDVARLTLAVRLMWRRLELDAAASGIPRTQTMLPLRP